MLAMASLLARAEPPRNTDRGVLDGWITTHVKMRLLSDPRVPALDIAVETVDGVVTLFGVVASDEARRRAGRLAAGTGGVVAVDNALLVSPPG
jgi:osmotically-inducible protein OsmY